MLISVCLCTYKRPALQKTLVSLQEQNLPDHCSLEIVVVDNDIDQSGRAICENFKDSKNTVRYSVNGERNLSSVRNSTLENAEGELLAFIDDDEWADPDWIKSLYLAMQRYGADAVFGRVNVLYPDTAPEWIIDGDLFRKDIQKTGALLTKGATSNALMKSIWVKHNGFRFDTRFGKSGGEDTDFFHRMYQQGAKLVFENQAIVSEIVESHRLNTDYLVKQNIRIGQTHWNYLWSKQRGLAFIKTGCFVLAQIVGAGLFALGNLPFGKKRYMRWYLLLVRNLTKIKTAVAGGNTVELYGNH
ncbi:hypothetical protein AB833_25040 [Chromatiales bacterium (ex Bugula neritina AB1)]|nr:hypothetical protein AB833_25040 [Chromatiales bacterium (ex Bugula neritina AB1)]